MPTVIIYEDPAQGSFINNNSGQYYDASENMRLASLDSSSNLNENQAFWLFDTSDASTGLGGKTITKIEFNTWVKSWFLDDPQLDPSQSNWALCFGSAPDFAQWNVPVSGFHTLANWFPNSFTAGAYVTVDITKSIYGVDIDFNRTGYSCARVFCNAIGGGFGDGYTYAMQADFSEYTFFGEIHMPYLVVTYTEPPPTLFQRFRAWLGNFGGGVGAGTGSSTGAAPRLGRKGGFAPTQ